MSTPVPTDEDVASVNCPHCYKGNGIPCSYLLVDGESVPQFHTERTAAWVEANTPPA
jgi:hypothetical protein